MAKEMPKTVFAMNRMNILVIREDLLTLLYEIDPDENTSPNDRFVLKSNDNSWYQELARKDAKVRDGEWLELTFKEVPPGKSFNLYCVPEDETHSPFLLLMDYHYDTLQQPEVFPTYEEALEQGLL